MLVRYAKFKVKRTPAGVEPDVELPRGVNMVVLSYDHAKGEALVKLFGSDSPLIHPRERCTLEKLNAAMKRAVAEVAKPVEDLPVGFGVNEAMLESVAKNLGLSLAEVTTLVEKLKKRVEETPAGRMIVIDEG